MGAVKKILTFLLILIFLMVAFSYLKSLPRVVSVAPEGLSVLSVSNNTSLDYMFDSYGNLGDGWTGSDGTYSLDLENGRIIWTEDDTILGTVDTQNCSREPFPETPIIHNSVLVESNGTICHTLMNYNGSIPAPEFETSSSSSWFWPGPAMIYDSQVVVLLGKFSSNGSNPLSYNYLGSYIAFMNESTLALERITEIRSGQIMWDQWLYHYDGYTYVFGAMDNTTLAYLARFTGNDICGQWYYYDGDGWTTACNESVPISNQVANGYSFSTILGHFVIFTNDVSSSLSVFGGRMCALVSDSITGPYNSTVYLFTTPEQNIYSNHTEYGVWTYGPHVQFQYNNGSLVVISYDVDGFGPKAFTNVSVYRPRFVDIRFA